MIFLLFIPTFALGFVLGQKAKSKNKQIPKKVRRPCKTIGLEGFLSYDGTEQNF
jgi:hypothetical protein